VPGIDIVKVNLIDLYMSLVWDISRLPFPISSLIEKLSESIICSWHDYVLTNA